MFFQRPSLARSSSALSSYAVGKTPCTFERLSSPDPAPPTLTVDPLFWEPHPPLPPLRHHCVCRHSYTTLPPQLPPHPSLTPSVHGDMTAIRISIPACATAGRFSHAMPLSTVGSIPNPRRHPHPKRQASSSSRCRSRRSAPISRRSGRSASSSNCRRLCARCLLRTAWHLTTSRRLFVSLIRITMG